MTAHRSHATAVCTVYDTLEPLTVCHRFAAYGGDKAAQTFAVRASGFEFEVQPQVFVVHVEHEHAKWRSE